MRHMNKTRYQTGPLSLSLSFFFVRETGGSSSSRAPRRETPQEHVCARVFADVSRTSPRRRDASFCRIDSLVDPTKSSRASLLSLHKNIQHPETLPLALRHYNRITKIRHDLPQIRRFSFLSVSIDVTLSLVDHFSISLEAEMVVSGLVNVQNNKLQNNFSLILLYDILKMKEIIL